VDAFSAESALHAVELAAKPRPFGKRNRRFDSPRRQSRRFCPAAFIFDERGGGMVNGWYQPLQCASEAFSGVNPSLN
jgi:hypothetical protein